MKNTKIVISLIFSILIALMNSCVGGSSRKIICDDDSTHCITIVKGNFQYKIFNCDLNSNVCKKEGYVTNSGIEEYFNALIRWDKEKTYIFYTYGIYNNSRTKSNIILKKISVEDFEKLKKKNGYKYFYY